MSQQPDPPRLRDLLSSESAELSELLPGLASARDEGPSADQLARICAGVALRATPNDGGPPNEPGGASAAGDASASAGAGAAASAAAAASSTTIAKLLSVLGVAVALGIASWLVLARSPTAVPAERPSPPASVRSAGSAIQRTSAVQHPRAPSTPPAQSLQPASRSLALTPHHSAGAAAPRHGAPSAELSDIDGELALLKPARADVRANPEHALVLTAQHAERFADGSLAEEREVIAIEALLALGRDQAADRRAQAFFAAYPGSAHTRRVHSLFAERAAALSHENPSTTPHPSR